MTDHAKRQAALYNDIWAKDPTYGTDLDDVYRTIEDRIWPHMERVVPYASHVVDFGAGDGRFLEKLLDDCVIERGTGIDVFQPDPQDDITWIKKPMWEATKVRGDYVISTDALEHLPPEHVEQSLKNIAVTAPHGFLRISLKEDSYGTTRGLQLHETIASAAWWLLKLRFAGIKRTHYTVYFSPEGLETALEVYF